VILSNILKTHIIKFKIQKNSYFIHKRRYFWKHRKNKGIIFMILKQVYNYYVKNYKNVYKLNHKNYLCNNILKH
jgi:hypothetical protein